MNTLRRIFQSLLLFSDRWIPFFILLWGTLYCLLGSQKSLMPLDHSIVMEGGWRILKGQWFFRDFYTPVGFVPSLMQAFFFLIFGKTWMAVRLHSAILNGLFGMVAFALLKRSGLPKILSAALALFSAVLFYAPTGLPFPDQHSFFFLLLAVWMALESPHRERKILWGILSFAALAAAWFSKTLPGGLGIPLIPLILILLHKKELKTCMAMLGAGFLVFLAFALIFYNPIGGNWDWIIQYGFRFPSETGQHRWESLPHSLKDFFGMLNRHPFWVLKHGHILWWRLLSVIFSISFAGIFLPPLRFAWKAFLKFLPGLALLYICGIFVQLTQNEGENGIPYLFISIGYIAFWYISFWEGISEAWIKNEKWKIGIRSLLISGFLLSSAFYALEFHRNGVVSLVVNNMHPKRFEWSGLEKDFPNMPRLIPKINYQNNPVFISQILQKEKGPFFLFGDGHFLYPLLDQLPWGPALWFHPGLSMPKQGSKEMEQFQSTLIEEFESRKLRYFCVESSTEHTWMGLKLEEMSLLKKWLNENSIQQFHGVGAQFEGWTVWVIGAKIPVAPHPLH